MCKLTQIMIEFYIIKRGQVTLGWFNNPLWMLRSGDRACKQGFWNLSIYLGPVGTGVFNTQEWMGTVITEKGGSGSLTDLV